MTIFSILKKIKRLLLSLSILSVNIYIITYFIFIDQSQSYAQNCATRVKSAHLKNLWKVSDSIYRSEQPNKKAFAELEQLGIKSVLNLRSHSSDDDEARNTSIKLYRLKMKASKVSYDDVVEAFRIISVAPKPILIHCKHGADRTGFIIAMYRVIYQNVPPKEAVDELVNCGYGFHTIYKNIPEKILNSNAAELKHKIERKL